MYEKIVTNEGVIIVPDVLIEDIGNAKFRVFGQINQNLNFETNFQNIRIESDSQIFSVVCFNKLISRDNKLYLEVVAW